MSKRSFFFCLIAKCIRLCFVAFSLMIAFAACGNTATTTSSSSTTPVPTATTSDYGYGSSAGQSTPTPTAAVTGPTQAVAINGLSGSYSFSPATLTVPVGTTVVWTNNTHAPHTVTSDDGSSFDSGANSIASQSTYSFKFIKAGTYAYHCNVHPSMKATIIVQ